MYIYIYIHIYSHIFTYIHIYSHIFTYIHKYSHIFTYIHIYSHIFTYNYSHIFTYIHIYSHIHIYIYTDTDMIYDIWRVWPQPKSKPQNHLHMMLQIPPSEAAPGSVAGSTTDPLELGETIFQPPGTFQVWQPQKFIETWFFS